MTSKIEADVLDRLTGLTQMGMATAALNALDQAGCTAEFTYRIRRELELAATFGGKVKHALTLCEHNTPCLAPCAVQCLMCGGLRELGEDECLPPDLEETCPGCR